MGRYFVLQIKSNKNKFTVLLIGGNRNNNSEFEKVIWGDKFLRGLNIVSG